MPAKDI